MRKGTSEFIFCWPSTGGHEWVGNLSLIVALFSAK